MATPMTRIACSTKTSMSLATRPRMIAGGQAGETASRSSTPFRVSLIMPNPANNEPNKAIIIIEPGVNMASTSGIEPLAVVLPSSGAKKTR